MWANHQPTRRVNVRQIIRYLEDFRQFRDSRRAPGKPISMKVPEDLLKAFETKTRMNNTSYQAQIKILMKRGCANG